MARPAKDAQLLPIGPYRVDQARVPRGMNTFVVFNQGAPKEVLQDKQFSTDGNLDGTSFTPAIGGMGYYPATSTPSRIWTNVGPLFTGGGSQPASFEVYLYKRSGSSTVYTGIHDSTPASTTYDHQLGITGTNLPSYYIYDGIGRTLSSPSTVGVGPIHIVGVTDGTTEYIYVNGALMNSVAVSNSGYTGFTTPAFCVGNQVSIFGATNGSTDVILSAGFATVAWTADEVSHRYNNMYDFLVPTSVPFWPNFLGIGGSTYNQTIIAAATASASFKRGVGKTLSVATVATPTLIRSVGKQLITSVTATLSMLKIISKTLTFSAAATTTLSSIKVKLVAFTTSVAATPALIKSVGRTVSTSVAATPAFIKSTSKAIVVSVTATPALIKSVGKVLATSAAATPSLIKGVGKKLTTTCAATVSMLARKCIVYAQAFTSAVVASATFVTVKSIYQAVLQSAVLTSYRPASYPTIEGSDARYILSELQKISAALEVHKTVTKSMDQRLTNAGF